MILNMLSGPELTGKFPARPRQTLRLVAAGVTRFKPSAAREVTARR